VNNIHPIFDKLLSREAKETLLNQSAKAFWFTGLSGSGKSTLARHLEIRLHDQGFKCMVLDGDNIRSGINSDLRFTNEDRAENIRRISEVSKLFLAAGIITLNTFISPTKAIRAQAAEIIGNKDFKEIYVSASLETCEERDVKGLYKKARNGEIPNFTGIDSPYEAPENPFCTIETDKHSIEESVSLIFNQIEPIIRSA